MKTTFKTLPVFLWTALLFPVAALVVHADDITFEHVMNIGSAGDSEGQFQYVEDFALSSDGHLLATDAAHAWIQVFDKTTGAYVGRFGGKGDEDEQLEKPEGIAVAPNGDVYVSDFLSGYVKVYDKDFNWKNTFSDYGTEPGENLKSEFIDIFDGLLFMPEAGNHRISIFDLDGNFIKLFGDGGDVDPDSAEGLLNNPEAAKVSSEGKVYVSDLKNDRIQVFDLDGEFLFGWGSTGIGPGEMRAPAGLAFDKDDNVYVTEIGNDRVQVFDKQGAFLTMFGTSGSESGQFGNIHGIWVDKETGWVYVADTQNSRIQVFKQSNDK